MSDLKTPGSSQNFQSQAEHLDLRSPETIEREKVEQQVQVNPPELKSLSVQEQTMAEIPDLNQVANTTSQKIPVKSAPQVSEVEIPKLITNDDGSLNAAGLENIVG
ncbi:hypothetical protein KC644_02550 [Candidatus Berkelbacteria bacterium]|nr:hypothetical protein [Candidatus Berkelbacteria bacterium]